MRGVPKKNSGSEAAQEDVPAENPTEPRRRSIEERLQRMEWPKPPPGMKERCLEQFMSELEEREGPAEPEPE